VTLIVRVASFIVLVAAAAIQQGHAQGTAAPATASDSLRARLQTMLDSLRRVGGFPGATFGITFPDGRAIGLATGMSDTALKRPMSPSDRLMQGSVGKTYVAAVALQLVHERKLDLDAPISRYLGDRPWFARLPNATSVTVRQLMNHTSGLVRYEFNPAFLTAVTREPMRDWKPEEQIAYLFDARPPFAPGEGWEYSDTNYIVLGLIIEQLTGSTYHAELRRRLLAPLGLTNTVPVEGPRVPGLAQGYAGPRNDFGGHNAMLIDGVMTINPRFEWTGGGMASTAEELARWTRLLFEGRAYDSTLFAQSLAGVPARLGPNTRYGLGVIIRDSPLGVTYAHSGFFPGYATEMLYIPSSKIAVAIQVNASDPYPRGLVPFLLAAARTASAR
jgi:D-alanyl-D-alanine carboxypeptidase